MKIKQSYCRRQNKTRSEKISYSWMNFKSVKTRQTRGIENISSSIYTKNFRRYLRVAIKNETKQNIMFPHGCVHYWFMCYYEMSKFV